MSDAKMYQVRLERLYADGSGYATRTAWIEERGAKLCAEVELKAEPGVFWRVVDVGAELPEAVLKEAQLQRRKPPPSIRDTKKDKKQQQANA